MPDAIVVGAGIGGLAAGIALRRAGWRVRIFERSAAPRELGFALNLAPNAIAALRRLGVAGPIEADGHRTGLVEIRTAGDRVLKRLDIAAAAGPVPSIVALRQTIHGTLLLATPAGDLVAGCAGDDAVLDGDRAILVRADGGRETADLLIGADGLGSAIRRRLHPHEPPPRPGGLIALRGVVRGNVDRLGDRSGVIHLGRGLEAAAIRASADAIYWFVSVPLARVPPGAVATDEVRARLVSSLPPSFRAIVDSTAPDDVRVDRLVDRDPLAGWGRGAVTLLGEPRIRCSRRPGRERRRRSRTRWRSATRWLPAARCRRRCGATRRAAAPGRPPWCDGADALPGAWHPSRRSRSCCGARSSARCRPGRSWP